METIWKYEFKDLSQEVQKIVMEGHAEYLELTEKYKYPYQDVINKLNDGTIVFDVKGNPIRD